MSSESLSFEVHHILPRELFNNEKISENIKIIFNTGNKQTTIT